jgi:putative ABC transport system ATP-binding protein
LKPLLEVHALTKRYGDTAVFANVDLQVQPGEFVAIIGESGVGKSTFLNCIAGLDTVNEGSVHISGSNITAMGESQQALFRRAHLGFVFQAFHVLPHLSVAHNVALPLLLLGTPNPARVQHVIDAVGLQGLESRLPQTLSGGQMQRVAIARALVHQPKLILADEPTGNLDPATASRVLDVLVAQVREQGAACVLVTHSRAAAARADRVMTLTADGMVEGEHVDSLPLDGGGARTDSLPLDGGGLGRR